jgi:hypothetical protein
VYVSLKPINVPKEKSQDGEEGYKTYPGFKELHAEGILCREIMREI